MPKIAAKYIFFLCLQLSLEKLDCHMIYLINPIVEKICIVQLLVLLLLLWHTQGTSLFTRLLVKPTAWDAKVKYKVGPHSGLYLKSM